ncbi:FHA domain-containing protein [Noviherbaspirillum sp. Root189]|uniref:FHA domain-containing protein n=1 Tax=Noviherbaspirillum sp. Root189 TaxID=1736487 RepID=UPI001F1B7DC9|nr:FHA domain-containing protein [Noviherbaspirillum sp. Root189]
MSSPSGEEVVISLKPVSHPELAAIHITDSLFPIGRTEPPFDTYPQELAVDLSRRHARIFCEYGAVYIADLGSKNGTTVNGEDIRQKTRRLQDGDTVCFGGALPFRVELGERAHSGNRGRRLASLTLEPERADAGLQPIVVTHFPFLISKADAAFARYKTEQPQQVNYLSRRHAHIFQKSGEPYVEDLGSTNGTFLNGIRLDEHAARLQRGDTLAFGGHHFVYKVGFEEEQPEADPTVTTFAKLPPAAAARGVDIANANTGHHAGAAASAHPAGSASAGSNADKTTFIAAADSFLNIFCVDPAPQPDEINQDAQGQKPEATNDGTSPRVKGKHAALASAVKDVFASDRPGQLRRTLLLSAAGIAMLVVVVLGIHLSGAPEREIKELLADGEYARAASLSEEYLTRQPESVAIKAYGTEALLRSMVPDWLAALQKRNYDQADAIIAAARDNSRRNNDVQALLGELQWIGNLERFVVGRGGLEAPIRLYVDDNKIRSLLKWWDEDAVGHQRALDRVAQMVPEFREPYAVALSHLRKVQSDKAVYLAAIDRLQATIVEELNQDRPQSLNEIFNEYADKYPRLAGMDTLREDLRRYIEIRDLAGAQRLGPLASKLSDTRLSTPPFIDRVKAMSADGRLPPAALISQYLRASQAWNGGNSAQAFAALEKLPEGPWSDVAARQLQHKKEVIAQFDALQKARGSKGYEDKLLGFYAMLDADEDTYFIRSIDGDIRTVRDKAIKRAEDMMARAQTAWRRYRDNGAIAGAQRLEAGVSNEFRAQARLLADAAGEANRGARIYQDLKAGYPPQWAKLQSEIQAEAELQRRSMLELQRVIEPGVLKAKLALLGGAEK